MSVLVPCSGCRRHLRRTEAVCPFCAVPVARDAVELPLARAVASTGVKRATLFAMGMSLATSACEADNTIPVYGAPSAPQAGSGGMGNSGGAAGSGGSAGSASASEPADASVARDASTGELDAGENDAAP